METEKILKEKREEIIRAYICKYMVKKHPYLKNVRDGIIKELGDLE